MIRILLFMVAAPILSCAAQSCPWINTGTAAGILGGVVECKVTQTSCAFTRRDGKTFDTLNIEIETMANPQNQFAKYLSACKSKPVPLEAVGNEAVTCRARHTGLTIGRVRDRAFVIRVTTNDRGATTEGREVQAQAAARHVAGNLF